MPKEFCATNVLPLKSIMWTSHSLWEGKNEDFQFIKSLIKYDKTPDHNTYNTMNFRNNGQSLKSKTGVIFTQLLDRTPSHPSKEHCRLNLHILLFQTKVTKEKGGYLQKQVKSYIESPSNNRWSINLEHFTCTLSHSNLEILHGRKSSKWRHVWGDDEIYFELNFIQFHSIKIHST